MATTASPKAPAKKKRKKSRRTPVKVLMTQQTPEQNKVSSTEIEHWMKEMDNAIRTYISRYGETLKKKLGYSEDDLINDVRFEVWKGLLTFDRTKARMKTYLDHLIRNRFFTLLTKTQLPKNNLLDYYADLHDSEVDDADIATVENAETLLGKRESIMVVIDQLNPGLEMSVLRGLLLGESLSAMAKENEAPQFEIIAAINKIDKLMKEARGESAA